jgi:maltooligosyltrehalose trehalohydrolase
VPDPQSEETFDASRLRWDRVGQGSHAAVLTLYRDLLRLRRALPLLKPGAAEPEVRHDEGEGWVAMRRAGDDQVLDAIFNFSADPRVVPVRAGAERLLDTDDRRYGGEGRVRLTGDAVEVPGHTAVLLRSRP